MIDPASSSTKRKANAAARHRDTVYCTVLYTAAKTDLSVDWNTEGKNVFIRQNSLSLSLSPRLYQKIAEDATNTLNRWIGLALEEWKLTILLIGHSNGALLVRDG